MISIFLCFAFLCSNPHVLESVISETMTQGGTRIHGELGPGDKIRNDGCYYDIYSRKAVLGKAIIVSQSSSSLDSRLIIISPSGKHFENDNYLAHSLDSRLSVLMDERGYYRIVCTSYQPQSGPYELSIVEREMPEIFGIFSGIEEYPPNWPKAPLCAEDAYNLQKAFVEAGLIKPENSIVLTDSELEPFSLNQAFQTIAGRIGPDDTFIFFFSGRGDRMKGTADPELIELDGMDEVLCLYSENITDNELAELLNLINTGLIIVVLDCCNSGGMAKDLIVKPGRVLFASSEEDTFADFASNLGAGGFLSLFFREAVEGKADLDKDGIQTLGEFSMYALKRFCQEVKLPSSSMDGYQIFVEDRGVVPQYEIMWFWKNLRK